MGFIYFMQSVLGTGPIKIGYSVCPETRISAHESTFKRARFKYCSVIEGSQKGEKRLHKKFSEHCIGGEWFNPVDIILEEIQTHEARRVNEWPAVFEKYNTEILDNYPWNSRRLHAAIGLVRYNPRYCEMSAVRPKIFSSIPRMHKVLEQEENICLSDNVKEFFKMVQSLVSDPVSLGYFHDEDGVTHPPFPSPRSSISQNITNIDAVFSPIPNLNSAKAQADEAAA